MNESIEKAAGSLSAASGRQRRWVGLLAVYVLFGTFFGGAPFPSWPSMRGDLLTPAEQVQVREASRWREGHLSLPARDFDTAEVDGVAYSHFPPFMTFLSVVVLQFSPGGVPHWLLTLLFVWTVPGLAYRLFLWRTGSVYASMVATMAYVFGTSAYSVMDRTTSSAGMYQLNHAISQVGLLLLLDGYYRGQAAVQSGIGLVIAGFSRLTTTAYALPVLVLAWSVRGWRRWGAVACIVLMIGVWAALNTMKFGSPLTTGYGLIYEGRTDHVAMTAQEGVFHPKWIDDNLYWMNLGFPSFEEKHGETRWVPNVHSTGIWWTTPLLLLVFWDARRIWQDGRNRWMLASVGVIYMALMLYHTMGYAQRGYNRFSLDFLVVLLAMIAPYAFATRARWIVSTMLAIWGIVYFRIILF